MTAPSPSAAGAGSFPQRIVILGSGHAGIELAAALRQRGHAGSITIAGGERDLPYQRPPLSKGFLKSEDDAGLPLKAESFFAAHDIALALGAPAVAIDRAGRAVTLRGGRRLGYDHLVIATGARNRIPPVPGLDAAPLLELRTLADARTLRRRLDRLRHVTIVGGGFVGLEVAALLRGRDVAVDLIEATPVLMGRVLSRPMSAQFRSFHESLGTRLHFETLVRAVDTAAGRCRVTLSSHEAFDTDAVLVAAGIEPNVEVAERAGLAIDDGIATDARLVTADPAISAIGDCASHPNPFAGARVRLESVQNAVDQARHVAARLTGEDGPYRAVPWFWSNQGEQRLQIAGLAAGHDGAVTRGDPASGRFSIFLYRGERLVAVESLNAAADHMAARRLIGADRAVPPELAADPAADLKALL